nr:B537 [uncultured bacterium]
MPAPAGRWLAASVLLATSLVARAETPPEDWNGFDLTDLGVPRAGLANGGQPRDGIPALTAPRFKPAGEAGLGFEDRVVGVVVDGVARAYPRGVLVWHEVVNDRIGDLSFVLVYSPLSGTVAGFDATSDTGPDQFGVSGLVYNSGTLLFDHASESLWLPAEGLAIAGPRKGQRLAAIPATETSWADWLTRYPKTQVLTTDTGHQRPYGQDPYADYAANSELRFPLAARSDRYHPKEPVMVLGREGHYRAYPFAELAAHDAAFTDTFAGATYRIDFNYPDQRVLVTDADGKPVPVATEYWFAWHAGHPTDPVYSAP